MHRKGATLRPPGFGATSTPTFDYEYWEPNRLYVCTHVSNIGTAATTGAYSVTLTTSAPGVTGEFYTPYGMSSIPADWQLAGDGTSSLTVTIPGPLAASNGFHISYWWNVPAGVTEVPITGSVSGGGERPGMNGNNTAQQTSRH